jgi:VanZ family protein
VVNVVPWFLPGVALGALVGALAAPAVARGLRSGRGVAWLLVFGLGMIVAATLTPLDDPLAEPSSLLRTCDLGRIGLAPLDELVTINDTSLNVALFIPLGIALGLLPGSGRKWAVVAAAILLPFAIETLQLLAPFLSRGCQSADVVDNLTGLVVGMVAATGARWLSARLDAGADPTTSP